VRVAVVGTGYVGLTTAAIFAHIGHQVTCVDVDVAKIELLRSGGTPIFEPYLHELLQINRERLHFSTNTAVAVADSAVIMVAVGTPSRPDGSADLSQMDAAMASIASGLKLSGGGQAIVVKSTAPVGNCRRVQGLLEQLAPGVTFAVASNPEFLPQGSAVRDSLYPDRIVVGTEDEAAVAALRELYAPIMARSFSPVAGLQPPAERVQTPPLLVMDSSSAELAKYAANAFLAMKISFINEIANVAELAGADVGAVARALALDPRIGGQHLKAGIGYGGSCFPKDTQALRELAGGTGYDFKLLKAIIEVNNEQWKWIARKLGQELGTVAGRRIALLGLAFKPGTDDIRESPALAIAETLHVAGALVRGYDPAAGERAAAAMPWLKVCSSAAEALRGADAAAIVTDWPQFRELDWEALGQTMRQPIVVDGRRLLAGQSFEGIRLVLIGTGEARR
jgi:UDPglucose 6-dehydrogenase